MFFRKEITAEEFAKALQVGQAHLFGVAELEKLLEQSKTAIEERNINQAPLEWMIFGLHLFRNALNNHFGSDTVRRDATLDSFFAMIYAGLSNAGLDDVDLAAFRTTIPSRFQEYDEAQANKAGAGPGWHWAAAIVKNVLGKPGIREWESMAFGVGAIGYGVAAGDFVKKLFRRFKVTCTK